MNTAYVPLLRLMPGECKTIGSLPRERREFLEPYFFGSLLPESDPQFDRWLNTLLGRLQHAVGPDDPYLLEWDLVSPGALKRADLAIRRRLLRPTYVGHPSWSTQSTRTLGRLARERELPVALRLRLADLEEERRPLASVDRWLKAVGCEPGKVDLVVDLESIRSHSDAQLVALLSTWPIPLIGEWRRVVLASGGFPDDAEVGKNEVRAIPRREPGLWSKLNERFPRSVVYGDYGPMAPRSKPATGHRGIPSVRYASDANWMFARADSVDDPRPQYRRLCRRIRDASWYSGRDFSWADAKIHGCAAGVQYQGDGASDWWVRVRFDRHFAVVLDERGVTGRG